VAHGQDEEVLVAAGAAISTISSNISSAGRGGSAERGLFAGGEEVVVVQTKIGSLVQTLDQLEFLVMIGFNI
jgi:hypothetical protein